MGGTLHPKALPLGLERDTYCPPPAPAPTPVRAGPDTKEEGEEEGQPPRLRV